MRKTGIDAEPFHGLLSQGKRTQVLTDFKASRITVVVATDVAAPWSLRCASNWRARAYSGQRTGQPGAGVHGIRPLPPRGQQIQFIKPPAKKRV